MNAVAERGVRVGQVHRVDAIRDSAFLECLPQGGEQGAREWFRRLGGCVDALVTRGVPRAQDPKRYTSVVVSSRMRRTISLTCPRVRDPRGNQMISGEPCGNCSRARGLSPRHFVLGPIGDLIIHA